ncbi:MAG: hypothetical protein JEZ04_22570 [Spirochaetales bacterium]|nr:hypothetical protein [Spirochaetales bacterium]
MKKIISALFIVMITAVSLYSQVSFSGSADIVIDSNISENGDYASLINPGNLLGMKDIGISSSITSKLDAGDEKTSFSAWLSLNEYPMGQVLLTSAYNDPLQIGGVLELTKTLGDTIFSMNLMRLSANVYLSNFVSMEVGRQSMLTGYGYGWNPIDFANPLKNPLDPDAALRGVDGISFKFFIGDMTALKIYGILPQDLLSSGLEYEEIKTGGELTMYFPGVELKLAGFYDYDNTDGSDAYTPSVGTGLMLDIMGIGVYGEAAIRKGSRSNFTDGTNITGRKDEWLFSALAGVEYTFSTELYAVAEYFYNGEGYNNAERSDFEKTLRAYGGATADLFSIYSPGYFAKHYVMFNLMQPLYDYYTDLNLSAIFSPDSGALTVMPSMNYSFSGNFSGKLVYVGMFDLYGKYFSEVTAMPVKHIISTAFTYSF